MKKILILIVALLIGGFVYLFQGGGINKVDYNKVVTYRLKDIFGFDFKAKKVELNELNELVISGLEIFGNKSGAVPMLAISEIRGVYDAEKLSLENELFLKNAKIKGITIPSLEQSNIDSRKKNVNDKLNKNFRAIFEEWDNQEEIQKVLNEIKGFYEKSKLSDLKNAKRTFEKAVGIESQVMAINLVKKPEKKKDLEDLLGELNKAVDLYNNGTSSNIVYDPEIFLDKRFSSLVKKEFYELDLIKFLFDQKIKSLGGSIISNLRELYKAQFFSPEAQKNFPELTIEKLEILEKLTPDSQNVMVGFLSNVTSKGSAEANKEKIKILVQGDFEKYKILGIDARIGIYKDDNKIITYNIRIQEVPIANYVLYEDDSRALLMEKSRGFIVLKGIVHKAEVRGDLTYQMSKLKFFRNPILDNVVSRIFDVFENKEVKRAVIIMDDKPDRESFVEVEYGDEYLETQEISPELTSAYNEDVMNTYFRNIMIESDDIKEKAKEIEVDYQKALSVIELIKNKLNGAASATP